MGPWCPAGDAQHGCDPLAPPPSPSGTQLPLCTVPFVLGRHHSARRRRRGEEEGKEKKKKKETPQKCLHNRKRLIKYLWFGMCSLAGPTMHLAGNPAISAAQSEIWQSWGWSQSPPWGWVQGDMPTGTHRSLCPLRVQRARLNPKQSILHPAAEQTQHAAFKS